jgi:hypothetical protein
MADSSESARRWTGAVFLGIALLMVVLGLTFLDSHLKDTSFVVYWLTCTVFTLSAATIALMDASAIRRHAVREHRKLIEATLAEIEEEQRKTENKSPGEKMK